MKPAHLRLLTLLAFLFASPPLWAQEDICCVMGKKSGKSVETIAGPRSNLDCQAGKIDGEFSICSAKPDPTNMVCPNMGAKERCGMCGYHWMDGTCLVEDPVAKAKDAWKKELKSQKKAEAAKEAAKKSKPRPPTGKPKP